MLKIEFTRERGILNLASNLAQAIKEATRRKEDEADVMVRLAAFNGALNAVRKLPSAARPGTRKAAAEQLLLETDKARIVVDALCATVLDASRVFRMPARDLAEQWNRDLENFEALIMARFMRPKGSPESRMYMDVLPSDWKATDAPYDADQAPRFSGRSWPLNIPIVGSKPGPTINMCTCTLVATSPEDPDVDLLCEVTAARPESEELSIGDSGEPEPAVGDDADFDAVAGAEIEAVRDPDAAPTFEGGVAPLSVPSSAPLILGSLTPTAVAARMMRTVEEGIPVPGPLPTTPYPGRFGGVGPFA